MSLTIDVLLTGHWDFLPTFLNLRPAFCPTWTHKAMKSLKTRPRETVPKWMIQQSVYTADKKRTPAVPLTKSWKSRRRSTCPSPVPSAEGRRQWGQGLGHLDSPAPGTQMLHRDIEIYRWLNTWRAPWLNSDFSYTWAKILSGTQLWPPPQWFWNMYLVVGKETVFS